MNIRIPLHEWVGLFAIGVALSSCGNADQAGPNATDSTANFEYAPETVNENAVIAAKAAISQGLSAKGSATLPRGHTFYSAYAINPGRTLTLWSSSSGSPGVDTVLVLFKRCDNQATWIGEPYTQRVCIDTLAFNDDAAGVYSRIEYKNTTNAVQNAWIMGFAYGSSTGSAYLQGNARTDPNPPNESIVYGNVPFTSGSYAVAAESQTVYTSGGGDPVLFGFSPNPYGGQGAWNDDWTDGNYESLVNGLAGFTWYVPVALASRETGNSTLYW